MGHFMPGQPSAEDMEREAVAIHDRFLRGEPLLAQDKLRIFLLDNLSLGTLLDLREDGDASVRCNAEERIEEGEWSAHEQLEIQMRTAAMGRAANDH
ncbi:hypothetical protein WV31_10660 [Magnetospirillum sp. ME-1]|nr:hypothetical protein WV31_10660 [Magnetospirillum sp. ME-1]